MIRAAIASTVNIALDVTRVERRSFLAILSLSGDEFTSILEGV